MENIKYQVFISSTYIDLIEERKRVMEVLLMANCIPAGMESFVAKDNEQFNVITDVIDYCDYYILIIGKRYGSVCEATGISYTEMEYNYAVNHGVPVLIFVIEDCADAKDDKEDASKEKQLHNFKERVMKNRLVSRWYNASDLMSKVGVSIMQAQKEIRRPGWHRGESVDKDENPNLNTHESKSIDLDTYTKSNISEEPKEESEGLFIGGKVFLNYYKDIMLYGSGNVKERKVVKTSLDKIFKYVVPKLKNPDKTSNFIIALNSFYGGYRIDIDDAIMLRNSFLQLNLIISYVTIDDVEMLRLTNEGNEMMIKLRNS